MSKDQLAVQQTVRQLFEALSNRDATALKANCTDDIRFYEYGKIWTIDTMITRAITKNIASDFKRINTLNFVNTTINKNVAWATYYLQSEIMTIGKQRLVRWLETVVLIKKGKRWRVKVLHSTSIQQN